MGYEKLMDDAYILVSSNARSTGTNSDTFELFFVGNENSDTGQLAKYSDAPNITYAEPLPEWIKSITFDSTGDGTAAKVNIITTGYEIDRYFGCNAESPDNERFYDFKLKNASGIVSDHMITLYQGCISYYIALIIYYPTEPVSLSLVYCGTYATDTAIFKTPMLSNHSISTSDCENNALLETTSNNVWFLRYKDSGGKEHTKCYYSLFSAGLSGGTFRSPMDNNIINISLHKDQFNFTSYPPGYDVQIYKYLLIQKHTYDKITRPTEQLLYNAVYTNTKLNDFEVVWDYYTNNVSYIDDNNNVDVKEKYTYNLYNLSFANQQNSVRWFLSTYWEGYDLSEG